MLIQLQRGPSREQLDADPVHLLLDCHQRIHRFLAIALKLPGAAGSVPDAEIADAARRVRRYFTEALPLHAQDEDESVAPRLRAVGAADAVIAAIEGVAREHAEIDRVTAQLVPAWTQLVDAPERTGEVREVLAAGAERLAELFRTHLAIEEKTVFPAVAALDEAARRAIVAEMRKRRPM
jgi:hemerythrin-like domain-containing protein